LFFSSVEAIRARNRPILRLLIVTGQTIGDDMAKKRRNYHEDLLERLKDPEYAAGYLAAALEEEDLPEVFLLALRDVAEARGMTQLARDTDLKRESLYTMLSERGNPVLSSLYAILDALDLRLSVVRKEKEAA
jgi:probable addiction module antidote protein